MIEFKKRVLFTLSIIFLISNTSHAIDFIEWGPEVGISFPQPLQLGAHLNCSGNEFFCANKVQFYSNVGYVYLPINKFSLRIFSTEIGSRYYVWDGAFYVSTGLGYRYISLAVDTSMFKIDNETVITDGSLRLNTLYLSPTVGWDFSISDSLRLGFDIGVQIPLFMTSGCLYLSNKNDGTNSDNSSFLQTNSQKAISRIAALPLPKLALIRFSWTFN